jgi:hypothetical protein
MADIYDGPAFPTSVAADSLGGLNYGESGMSLRDWFAGQALARIDIADAHDEEPETLPTETLMLWIEWQARYAYAVADAMLKAREEKP